MFRDLLWCSGLTSRVEDRGGFEPPKDLHPYWISNPALSTAQPPVRPSTTFVECARIKPSSREGKLKLLRLLKMNP